MEDQVSGQLVQFGTLLLGYVLMCVFFIVDGGDIHVLREQGQGQGVQLDALLQETPNLQEMEDHP
jgi:hypothetical protein